MDTLRDQRHVTSNEVFIPELVINSISENLSSMILNVRLSNINPSTNVSHANEDILKNAQYAIY